MNFDQHGHGLTEQERRHGCDDQVECAVIEVFPCNDADQQRAEDEDPRAVVLRNCDVFSEEWICHARNYIRL